MKKYIAILLLAASAIVAACTEEPKLVEDPIEFSVSTGGFTAVLDTPSMEVKISDGTEVGVFVNSTREMLFHVGNGRLVADEVDIPRYYGNDAYAVVPATKNAVTFVDACINIPAAQTFSGGVNSSLVNSLAYSKVEDGKAEFSFSPMNAVMEFGFSSDDNAVISSMTISAPSLTAGSYIAGKKKFAFSGSGFELTDKIENGSSIIKVTFPEPITLSSEPTFIPVAVLPFMTTGGGVELTLYNEFSYPYEIGAVLTDNDEYCNGGVLDVTETEYVSKYIGKVAKDSFAVPAFADFSVKVNKTGELMANQDVNIYSLSNEETFVRTVNTGADGWVKIELIPGDYKAYIAREDGSDDAIRSVVFKILPESTVEVELVYYSFIKNIFYDDFQWITPEMGEGDKALDFFVVNMTPGSYAVNTGTKANSKIDVVDAGAPEKIAEIGWNFYQPAPNPGKPDVTWVYLRLGEIQMGRSKGYAQATTPAMKGLEQASTVLFSIVADPFYKILNNGETAVALPTQLQIEIIGDGSFKDGVLEKIAVTAPIESGDLSHPQEVPDGHPKTFGQKTYYDFLVYGVTSETQFCIRTYDEKVADRETYADKQILIDEVKVSLAE